MLEKYVASIFMAKEYAKQGTTASASCLHPLVSSLAYSLTMKMRAMFSSKSWVLYINYMMSQPKRPYS